MDRFHEQAEEELFSAADRARYEASRALDAQQAMRCPACGNALNEETCLGVRAAVCRACEGVWLDRDALEALSGPGRAAAVAALRAAAARDS